MMTSGHVGLKWYRTRFVTPACQDHLQTYPAMQYAKPDQPPAQAVTHVVQDMFHKAIPPAHAVSQLVVQLAQATNPLKSIAQPPIADAVMMNGQIIIAAIMMVILTIAQAVSAKDQVNTRDMMKMRRPIAQVVTIIVQDKL